MFSKKMRDTSSRVQGVGQGRSNNEDASNGYALLSPVSSAILWVMQSAGVEEYRVAALAAWECLTTTQETSIGSSRTRLQHVGRSRASGNDNQDPIEVEVQRMNLADDSADVRRLALRILMSRKKFRSTVGLFDTPH